MQLLRPGSDKGDPAGLSKRQAARLVYQAVMTRRMIAGRQN